MVLAYLEVYDAKTGEAKKPEIQDITKEMDGSLIIWNQRCTMFRIELSGQPEHAGTIFTQLARHIPFAFLGNTPWREIEDDKDFHQMMEMIRMHKRIYR